MPSQISFGSRQRHTSSVGSWSSWWCFLLLLVATTTTTAILATEDAAATAKNTTEEEAPTCSWLDEECHFRTMTVDLGHSKESFRAYVTPDVATFYNKTPGALKPKPPKFLGLFGKFINMSPHVVRVMWDPMTPGQPQSYISDIAPFESAGTATFPGHVFHVSKRSQPKKVIITFHVVTNQSLYIYDPFDRSVTLAQAKLSHAEFQLYQLQHDNLLFAEQYRQVTGREWLALYSRKYPPRYPMWPALYLGQRHTVSTTEWPFVEVPPEHLQGRAKDSIMAWAHEPDEAETKRDRKLLEPYRAIPNVTNNNHNNSNVDNTTTNDNEEDAILPTWNITLKVLSCSPRVFEISNFLSPAEVDHVMQLATGMTLAQSTTQAGRSGEQRTDSSTRTSLNSWLSREKSLVLDALYRRAADVLQMDESLFRFRKTPHPSLPESQLSIAERLQLVHYDVGQQYTAHHDFAMPGLSDGQPSRFATLLFYLNEGMTGGETSFPRWLNAKTKKALKVKPKAGKAILFYNVLPDGNYDERSQHAAEPVTKGEKWLTNLWVWDPFLEFGR